MPQLNGSAGPSINGNLFLAGSAVNEGTQVTGTEFSNFAALSTDWSDALNASATFAGLSATQHVAGGAVTGTTIITGMAGVNVVDISSLNLGNGQTLTLNGPAGAQFVINDSGNFVLNSGEILLAGGLTVSDVVFNVLSSGNAIQTSGGLNNESVVNGILLGVNSGVAFAPGLINGELIAGGSTVHLVSGASVRTSTPGVPEPATYTMLGTGLTGLLWIRRKFQRTVR